MFQLTKHYYDVIDAQGNALIVYDAQLRLFGLSIPYSSVIFSNAQGETQQRHCLAALKQQQSQFTQTKLALVGQFQALQHFPSLSLLQTPPHRLEWHCHSPKTVAEFQFQQQLYRGFGYAETLSLNFFPWKLPMDELYWGRFLSENYSVVWIEWRGTQPLKKLIVNQSISQQFDLTPQGLSAPDFELHVDSPILIKNDSLREVVKSVPLLSLLANRRFLNSQEIKWKSRATLQTSEGAEQGWALYEQVIWRK